MMNAKTCIESLKPPNGLSTNKGSRVSSRLTIKGVNVASQAVV